MFKLLKQAHENDCLPLMQANAWFSKFKDGQK